MSNQLIRPLTTNYSLSPMITTLIVAIVTFVMTILFLSWLFDDTIDFNPTSNPIITHSTISQLSKTTTPIQKPISTSIQKPISTPINRLEVFNLKDNQYTYTMANKVCQKYGARLATAEELATAHANGANWCNLGWVTEQHAYYPTNLEQIKQASNWPEELREGCGHVGLNGGQYPSQLKLSVNCYGIKPKDNPHINPFNTITNQYTFSPNPVDFHAKARKTTD